eukprot:CAMPEP_0179126522 /NCGR_PEP_ID=MMETSP0796-20121207/59893_1 /TAXON_ID=73915 /ORGANISM="Pyrodinium bahamense, Strain pbaha01" /LENGTH=204 /DNA_ID=CAMNT_0020825275 /DNA_START=82 /DNA_END=696 /DNA_ORIENTATION=+
MAVALGGAPHPLTVRRAKPQGFVYLAVGAAALWWTVAPVTNSSSGVAFAGVAPPPGTGAVPRGRVAVQAGRDWKAGNVPKKQDFRAMAAKGGGGKKKKGQGSKVVDKTPPKIYTESKVVYNGEVVGTLNGTMAEYKVDIWSGAHPIWQGKKGKVLLDASSVTKFQEKFGVMADVFGDAGLEQLEMNKKLKKEQEEREKMGLKTF